MSMSIGTGSEDIVSGNPGNRGIDSISIEILSLFT